MEPSWINDFTRLNIDKNELKCKSLVSQQINDIDNKIIKVHNLTESAVLCAIESFSYERGYIILEVMLLRNQLDNLVSLAGKLRNALDIPARKWDWSHDGERNEDSFYYKLRFLRVLLERQESEPGFLDNIVVLSYHSHPSLPWTSKLNSTLVETIVQTTSINERIHNCMDEYINEKLRPELLVVPNRNIFSQGRFKSSKNSLRPKLGYGSVNAETTEEDSRRTWKNSTKTRSLSMVWFLIRISGGFPWFKHNWTVLTSFILNLLEDHEVLFKAHACILLEALVQKLKAHGSDILLRSGLLELFIETTKSCLSYLPNLISNEESVFILSKSYAALYSMLEDKKDFIELLNKTLSSIAHLKSNRSAIPTLIVLLDQIIILIKKLDYNLLISMSRINFCLNQLIVDPTIIEESLVPVKLALTAQHTILEIFDNLDNTESLSLIFAYRYDFLASWVVLFDRVSKDSVTDSIRLNYALLERFSRKLDMFQEFSNDMEKIKEAEPNSKTLLHSL